MILVTAFEPFGGDTINPAALILEKLPDEIGGHPVEKLLLPVAFGACGEIAFAAYDRLKPAAVVMLGQHGGADAILIETVGVNRMHAFAPDGTPRPDNAGFAPKNEPLVLGGAEKLFATLPVDDIVRAVGAAGVKCAASADAGKYVCNALLYGMLDHCRGEVPAGFIHVPFVKEQGHTGKPYMELDDMVRGVAAAIGAAAESVR